MKFLLTRRISLIYDKKPGYPRHIRLFNNMFMNNRYLKYKAIFIKQTRTAPLKIGVTRIRTANRPGQITIDRTIKRIDQSYIMKGTVSETATKEPSLKPEQK